MQVKPARNLAENVGGNHKTTIMRRYLIILILISFIQFCQGQKLEYSVQLGSGLFSFGGKSSTNTSFLNISDQSNISNYTNNPYGQKSGFSFSISSQIQKLTLTKKIFGLQIGYESLTSKVTLIYYPGGDFIYSPPINCGQTYLMNHFINLFPYFGQRFVIKSIDLDLTGGADFGFCTESEENGSALINNTKYTSNVSRDKPSLDFRLRAGLTAYYKKTGLSIGYSYGLTNYTPRIMGANLEEYSRLFRFGIIYKI